MIAASINMLPQALARVSTWSVVSSLGPFIIPLTLVALIAVLFAHDVAERRRPHPATVLTLGVTVLVGMVTQSVAQSTVGLNIMRAFM